MLTGTARIGGSPVVLGVLEFALPRRQHGLRRRREAHARASSSRPRSGCRSSSWPRPAARGCRRASSRSCRWRRPRRRSPRLADERAALHLAAHRSRPPAASPRASPCSATSCSRSRARSSASPARASSPRPSASRCPRASSAPSSCSEHGQLDLGRGAPRAARDAPAHPPVLRRASARAGPMTYARGRGSPPRAPRRRAWRVSHPGLARIEALLEALGNPERAIPDRPGRRHQRQGLDRGDAGRHRHAPPGCRVGALHLAAPPVLPRAHPRGRPGRSRPPTWWTASRRIGTHGRAPRRHDVRGRHRAGPRPLRARGVDVAVLEVGLGGRLDATHGGPPEVEVLGPIDYDHQATGSARPSRPSRARRPPSSGAVSRCPPASGRRSRRCSRGAPPWRACRSCSRGRELRVRGAEPPLTAQVLDLGGPDWRARRRAVRALRAYSSRATPSWPRRRRALGARRRRSAWPRRPRWPGRFQVDPPRTRPSIVLSASQPGRRARARRVARGVLPRPARHFRRRRSRDDKDRAGIPGASFRWPSGHLHTLPTTRGAAPPETCRTARLSGRRTHVARGPRRALSAPRRGPTRLALAGGPGPSTALCDGLGPFSRRSRPSHWYRYF